MAIRFLCFKCGVRIKVPDGTQGRKVRCPSCGASQRVPDASTTPPPPPELSPPPEAPPEASSSESPPEVSPESLSSQSSSPESPLDDQATSSEAGDMGDGDDAFASATPDGPASSDQPDGSGPDDLQPDEPAPMTEMSGDEVLRLLDEASQPDEADDTQPSSPPPAGSAESESPALPWTDIPPPESSPEPSPEATPEPSPEAPQESSAVSSSQGEGASSSSHRPSQPPTPQGEQGVPESLISEIHETLSSPSAALENAASTAPGDDDAIADGSGDAVSVSPSSAAGVTSAGVVGSLAGRPQPRPQPMQVSRSTSQPPRAIALGASSQPSSASSRPPRVNPQPMVSESSSKPGGSSRASVDLPAALPLSSRGQDRQGSSSDRPRPLYRGLQATAALLRLVALALLGVAVLQGLSWQSGTLPQTLGEAGHKLLYLLQVALPLGLAAIAWGVAVCCTALRTLLRR